MNQEKDNKEDDETKKQPDTNAESFSVNAGKPLFDPKYGIGLNAGEGMFVPTTSTKADLSLPITAYNPSALGKGTLEVGIADSKYLANPTQYNGAVAPLGFNPTMATIKLEPNTSVLIGGGAGYLSGKRDMFDNSKNQLSLTGRASAGMGLFTDPSLTPIGWLWNRTVQSPGGPGKYPIPNSA